MDDIHQLNFARVRTFVGVFSPMSVTERGDRILNELTTKIGDYPVQGAVMQKICIQCGARVFTYLNGVPVKPMACGH